MRKDITGHTMIRNLIHRLEESSRLDAMLKEDLDSTESTDSTDSTDSTESTDSTDSIEPKTSTFDYEQNEIIDILFESSYVSKPFINRMGVKKEGTQDIFESMRKSLLKL